MGSKRILILGGGRYNVPSIQAAREAGFVTLVADRSPAAPGLAVADHALPIDLNDCETLVQAVAQHGGIDGVVSMAEVGVRAAANISTRLGLPSISEESAAHATSKSAMRRLWQAIGAYSTDFEIVSTLDDAQSAVARLGQFPLIFKPDRSFGGSRGVTRVETNEDVSTAFHAAQAGGLPDSDVVVERWVEGSEHSCEVLIWQGETSLLCIGQKIKSLLPYRVDVSVQYPAQLSPAQEATVAEMCHHAVRALGLTQGAAHVEFGYADNGPVLFELGARCGGGHTPQIAHHVSGVNEFVEACRMACGIPPAQFIPTSRRGADYRFVVFAPGTVEGVTIPKSVANDPRVLDVGLTVRPGDEIRPLRSTSERAGFLVATGETLPEAVERADHGCREILVRYADGTARHAAELTEFREWAHS
ncbi:MAG TPA: ATP-grasp domain-containing protein [Candidatus Dormibacteraeota bacterium]|nr:ATP-grasp domain-containing protein [Candidatus Dormibacteraeota bacterium]